MMHLLRSGIRLSDSGSEQVHQIKRIQMSQHDGVGLGRLLDQAEHPHPAVFALL